MTAIARQRSHLVRSYLPIAVHRHNNKQQHGQDHRWDDDVQRNLVLLLVAHGAHVPLSMAKLYLMGGRKTRSWAKGWEKWSVKPQTLEWNPELTTRSMVSELVSLRWRLVWDLGGVWGASRNSLSSCRTVTMQLWSPTNACASEAVMALSRPWPCISYRHTGQCATIHLNNSL